MTPSKEQNKTPVIGPKEIEGNKIPNKEFKIVISKKLSELQENRWTTK
jgi:hypothetical protein